MRTAILLIVALLAGCGNSSDDDSTLATRQQVNAIPNESTAVASLRAEVATLQGQMAKMQLIGHPRGAAAFTNALILGGQFLPNATSFGPCPDMGVQDGFNSIVGDALTAVSKAFKTCTGYHVEYLTSDGSVKVGPRMFWDGPNCTGRELEWEAGGTGYDTETLHDGVVFASPVDGTILMVASNQTPQPILIQSAFVLVNSTCQSDVETQNMYLVSPNVTQTTGAPSIPVGQFTTGSP